MRQHRTHRSLLAAFVTGALLLGSSARADDTDEYKPEIPEVSLYKAMLDANRPTGWVQFRDYDGRQLIYFTALQTMHCRLSDIRYSINSEALDQHFPVADCNPQLPFNLPDDPTNRYFYIEVANPKAETIAVQVVWDDGSGSEIVVYKPCEGAGDATCAQIKTIKKPMKMMTAPSP